MNRIGVVYCPKKSEEIVLRGGMQKYFPAGIRKILLGVLSPTFRKIEFKELQMEIFEVQFPLMAEALNLQKDEILTKLCRKVEAVIKAAGISNIILSGGISKSKIVADYFDTKEQINLFNGRNLFAIYIDEVLKKVCTLLKITMSSVRMGIIADVPDSNIVTVIKNISREVRFFSILSSNHENFIPLVESIYEETGLAVSVGNDERNILKDCNIVINFSCNQKIVSQCKLRNHVVIINCSNDFIKKNVNGIIINDIELCSNNSNLRTYPWARQTGFCEAMLNIKTNGELNYNCIVELKEMGYIISGFIGCSGKINMSEFSALANHFRHRKVV